MTGAARVHPRDAAFGEGSAMSMSHQDKPTVIGPRPISWIAVAGFVIGIVGVLLLLVAALGVRFDWWHFRFSLLTLMKYGAFAGVGGLIVSLIGLGRSLPGGIRRGATWALVGVLLSGFALYMPASGWWKVKTLPFIHDITTDTENPPQFRAVVAEREAEGANPYVYEGPDLARKQKEGYPDLGPLIVPTPPDKTFTAALQLARDLDWTIAASEPDQGRIEGTDTTFWFGFKDDVVVRIEPTADGGSRVDMRSLSRVGRSDVGHNAERIQNYLSALRGRLS
ncbi:MAG: hypothetical protein CMM50_14650 [Rhodospirillaceae bacterium]|nr:hypothetical protein [Rhodospirillaceae bacterium]